MNKKVYKALNEQMKHEFYSSFLYLSMVSYLENIPLDGMGKWFRKQAKEEHEHAMKIFNYIIDRNQQVDMQAIDKPPTTFKSLQELFELALKHEKKVTHWIHEIYELAIQEKDYATQVFLQWFIEEQVEEEKNANDNLDQIKLIGDDKGDWLILDNMLGKKAES